MSQSQETDIPVDLANVLDALGNNTDILQKIIVHLKENSQVQLAELQQGITAGNFELVRKIAHTLKGSLANFGAERAVSVAFSLETAAATGNLSQAQDLYDELGAEIKKILAYFASPDWQKDWL